MLSLFDADDVAVRYAVSSVLAHTASFEIVDGAGTLLATVRQEGGRGLLGRLLAERPGRSAADLDVVDPSGARLFAIAKASGRLGRLGLAASLADGRPVGSASGRARRSGEIVLYDPSDAPLGLVRRDSAVAATVTGPDGSVRASIARQLRVGAAGAGGPTVYQVRFGPPVPVASRILTLAVVIAGSLQRAL